MIIETKDATPLAVDVWGDGRPVVLVHAWGLSAHMWNAQLPALLGAGLQVVTFDHRGHGRSGRSSGGYDLDTMAADVLAGIDPPHPDDVVLGRQSKGGTLVAPPAGRPRRPRPAQPVPSRPVPP